MKLIIRKVYFNYENEEKWLNEMSAKGLALTDYKWCKYVFEDCEPGEYIYRLEILDNWSTQTASRRYIRFMEETEAEVVAVYFRWVYFRRKASDGAFDIYSDFDSRIKHYRRIINAWWWIGIANIFPAFTNIRLGIIYGFVFNIFLGLTNLSIAILLTTLCLGYYRKIKKLKRDKILNE